MLTPGPTSMAAFELLLEGSEHKLELLEGEVVAFAGGSVAHGMLCSRLHAAISNATRPPCQTFTSDVAVRLAERNSSLDVTRTCEPLDASANAIAAPISSSR